MPEPTVTVRLSLDDSQLQEGARKAGTAVKNALSGDGNKASEAFDKLGRAAHDSSEHVKRHGEAAREAKEKLEPLLKLFDRGKEQVTDFGKEIRNAALSFVGFAGAFEMVKRAMEQGAAAEQTRVRFENLVGTTRQAASAFTELQAIARETSTPMREVAETAEAMYAGGESIGEVTEQMGNLARIAKITGTPLGEIGELLERIRLHGDVTFRELFRLTQATGGATRELAVQYRDIPRELELIKTAAEGANKIQAAAFEAAEKWHTAIEQVAKKGGLLDAVFKQWQTSFGFGRTAMAGLLPAFNFGPWGLKAGRELMESFNEGMKQVSSETGMSVQSVMRMVQAGLYTAEDLLEKAKERREAIQRIAQASMEASRAMVEGAFQQRQIAILDQIGAALQKTSSIAEQFGRVENTMEATMERASMAISRGFTQVGKAINSDLMPALRAFAEGDWVGAVQRLPLWLDAIAAALGAIAVRSAAIAIADIFKAAGAAVEWFTARLGGAVAAEEALGAAEAITTARANAQAAAAAEAGAAKGAMAAEATTAAAAEGELATAETAAGTAAATAAGGGLAAFGAGLAGLITKAGGAALAIGEVATGIIALNALKMDITGELSTPQLKKLSDDLEHARMHPGAGGIPDLGAVQQQAADQAASQGGRWGPLLPTRPGTGVPLAPGTAPVWDPSRWPNLQQQAIAGTRGQLMAGVPAGLTDPRAREMIDRFATGIATMKNALEQHDMNAARQAAADIQREAGRVGLITGRLSADQIPLFNQGVTTLYKGLAEFIQAAGDLPKEMQPLTESLQDSADAFQKAAEPPLGHEEFYPQAPPPEKPAAGAEPSRTRDQGEERRAEDIRGRVQGAYAKWFYSRGEAAKQAEIELRSEMADAAAHGVQPFQHGGIVRHRTLALLGEAGPEAVIPLSGDVGHAIGWGGDVGHAVGWGAGGVGGPAGYPHGFTPGGGAINPLTGHPTFLTGRGAPPPPSAFPGLGGAGAMPGHPGVSIPAGAVPMPGQPGWYHFPGAPGSFRVRPVGSDATVPGLSPGGPHAPTAPGAPTHPAPPGADVLAPLYGPGHARYGVPGETQQAAMARLLRGGGAIGPGGPMMPGNMPGWNLQLGPGYQGPPSRIRDAAGQAAEMQRLMRGGGVFGPSQAPPAITRPATPAPPASSYTPVQEIERHIRSGTMMPSGGFMGSMGGMSSGAGGMGGGGIVSTSDEGVLGRLDELLSIFRTA